jgi:excisionase family DNA binding protein
MAGDLGGWRQDDAADVYRVGPPTLPIARVGRRCWRMGKDETTVTAKPQELLTLAEAAAYLRVHRRTMSRLLQQRVVPGAKIGRQWRVRVADLDAVLAGGTVGEPHANGREQGEVRGPASRLTHDGHAS